MRSRFLAIKSQSTSLSEVVNNVREQNGYLDHLAEGASGASDTATNGAASAKSELLLLVDNRRTSLSTCRQLDLLIICTIPELQMCELANQVNIGLLQSKSPKNLASRNDNVLHFWNQHTCRP